MKTDRSEKLVRYNDITLFTESFGNQENPAILLLAGATVSMLFWDEAFCRQLAAQGFLVIRYDNRDVGQSTHYAPGSTPYDIVDLVDDAVAIVEDYQIQKAHWVGMSLGGLIAQIAALKYPDRVATLTLMSTGPWGDSDPNIPDMDTRILDFHAKSSSVDWSKEDSVVEYMLEGAVLMSGKKPYNTQRGEKLIRREFQRAHHYLSMFNHAALQGGESFYNRLDEINQPTLLIHGTDDLIWHFRHTHVMLEKIRNAKLMVLEGTGHELHEDDWDKIIQGIANHILG